MEQKDVSYIVFESVTARLERTIEKLWMLAIILIVLLVGSNCAWMYYENQFEDTVTTVTQELDAESGNAIINDGVHINGESETDSNN